DEEIARLGEHQRLLPLRLGGRHGHQACAGDEKRERRPLARASGSSLVIVSHGLPPVGADPRQRKLERPPQPVADRVAYRPKKGSVMWFLRRCTLIPLALVALFQRAPAQDFPTR